MSFVKAIFGNVIGEDLTISEGQVGYTEKDHQYKELEKRGLVKLFKTSDEADAFEFIPSKELFNQSYKSLNPPEGETALPSKIDWDKGEPVKINGVPANYITKPVVKKVEIDKPTEQSTPEDLKKK